MGNLLACVGGVSVTNLEYVKKLRPDLSEKEITDRCPSLYDLKDYNICNNNGSLGLCESCWNEEIEVQTC